MSKKILLSESEMPTRWFNLMPHLPKPLDPPLHPGTHQVITPNDMAAIFPMNLIEQEMCGDPWVDIPEEILKVLSMWRPTPLVRADRLEAYLGTPAKIFYKNESVSPAGSHKPNTAVAQAYYNKVAGVKRLVTETGAGQWGSALSFATNLFGLGCRVFMVKCSFYQKPYRKSLMRLWGGEVFPSPTDMTNAGRAMLARDPDTPGSLGCAIAEAVEEAALSSDANYSLGSVLNHVCLHQSVIGLEAKKQLESVGLKADVVIGCAGGGSNFAGIAFPFIPEKLGGRDMKIIGVEPAACPTMTKGPFRYDFGDTAKSTPLLKMHTLGHDFVPAGIHAGGLRYHGMAPLVSAGIAQGIIQPENRHQLECFEAAVLFARTEGIVPAPETSHAIRVAIDEALACKKTKQSKVIVFNFSGHGHFDMSAYDAYFDGKLQDYEFPMEEMKKALAAVPVI